MVSLMKIDIPKEKRESNNNKKYPKSTDKCKHLGKWIFTKDRYLICQDCGKRVIIV